jgi:hypothetical protein
LGPRLIEGKCSARHNTEFFALLEGWNDRGHPLFWAKTEYQILKKANCNDTSNLGPSPSA